jgi:hypothetical protein
MPAPPKAALEDNPELAMDPIMDLDGQPELDAASEDMPAEVVIPKPVSKKKLKVTANMPGFIHSERKAVGQKFEVHEHELGSWMDCDDPVEHKKHLARIAEKKKKVNQKSILDQMREKQAGE